MSRIRDLRELICVSRLTYRESDDDVVSDDADTTSNNTISIETDTKTTVDVVTTAAFRKLHLSDENSAVSDSGIVANGTNCSTTDASSSSTLQKDSDGTGAMLEKTKRRKRRKKKSNLLPSTSSGDEHKEDDITHKLGDFDDILCYLDATIVSEWLLKANDWVDDLSVWCHTGTNFIDLANFLITEFPHIQRQKILELEYSIFMDELQISFSAGQDAGKVRYRHLQHLALAVFREYPSKLLSKKGIYLFLDYLDILSSEKHESYRKLLSDVKISTQNRQYAQLLLAVRAFGLASLWSAVVNFYRKLKGSSGSSLAPSVAELKVMVACDQSQARMLQAIRCELVEVLTYFLQSNKVSCSYRDDHGRSLLHLAIMNNRERVLEYLLTQTDCQSLVNSAATNGNTPLHAAINNGNINMVRILLKRGSADCNVCNPHCDNAAPIHLATMHGYRTIVELLLDAGADQDVQMGDLNAVDMADEFHQTDIKEILLSRKSSD